MKLKMESACGAGAEPAGLFQMGKTELSHQLPTPNNFQNNPRPPPHRPRFHPRPGGREGLRPASILGLQLLQKTPGAQDGRGAVREGGALPAVSSDLRRIARRIGNAQTERTTVGRNSLQRIPLGAQGYK